MKPIPHPHEHARGVGDQDPARGRGLEVDVVVAHRDVGHDAQGRAGGVQELTVDPVRDEADHGGRAGDGPEEIGPGERVVALRRPDLTEPVQDVQRGRRHAAGDDDERLGHREILP
jgi:hypothetical protein